ncbi:MAG: hypothetical protein M3Y87_31020 [Myxococcota bacterium]|nr:hypothetical protein [Myxococcota bacterium]
MDRRRPTSARPRLALHVASLCAAIALAGTAGCGGDAAPAVQVTGPFTDEHAVAFENGLDLIENPTSLEGAWLRDWEEDIDRRVSLADAIALVEISTVRTDVDLDRRETFRLVARVRRERHGELPDEVTLVTRPTDPGYASIRSNQQRVLNQQFVLFLKWAEEDGQVVARWHLSPAADRVVRRVNSLAERRHTPVEERRRVIVRESGVESSGGETDDEDDGF